MRQRWRLLLGLLLTATACILGILAWGSDGTEALAAVNARWGELRGAVETHPVLAALLFFLCYVVFTGLSLPGALFLTVLGGALFGVVRAVCLVSFASTLGATLAFLLSRHLLRDWVAARQGDRWQTMRREIDLGGGWYLLAARLNPLIPYFLVNLLFGLTRMPVWRFWLITQIGTLPSTILYAYAGDKLGQVQTLSGLVSQEIIGVLVLLSLFPIILRWLRRKEAV